MRAFLFVSILATAACAAPGPTAKPAPEGPRQVVQAGPLHPAAVATSAGAQCGAHFLYSAATNAQNEGGEEDLAQAKVWLDQALLLQPDHASALFRRGTILLQQRKLDEALVDLEAAVGLDPELVLAHYNLACGQSLSGDTSAAHASLIRALDAGYRNTANIDRDADLENLRASADMAALLAPYGEDSAPVSTEAEFQTMGSQRRLEYLVGGPDLSSGEVERIATLATRDAAPQVRALGFLLRTKLDGGHYEAAAIGLCDANGGVGKTVADALIASGPSTESAAVGALAYTVSDAPLYAIQVLGVVGSSATPPRLVPFLADERPLFRIAAAQALAKLGAAEHVPEIEAALANTPEEGPQREVYEVELRRAIQHLERPDKPGG